MRRQYGRELCKADETERKILTKLARYETEVLGVCELIRESGGAAEIGRVIEGCLTNSFARGSRTLIDESGFQRKR